MWVGLQGGISRFDPASDGFVNYRPVPDNPASLANTVWVIYQDRSGALWAGTWGGVLIRFRRQGEGVHELRPRTRATREGSTAVVSTPSSKTGPGHYGWERSADCTGTTAEAERFARYTESDGPAQQQHSMHSGRSTRQALAQHPEGRIQV